MFAGYLILRFENGREIRQINPSQTLMNLQYYYSYYYQYYMYRYCRVPTPG